MPARNGSLAWSRLGVRLGRSCSRTLPPAGTVGPLARSCSRTLALVPPAGPVGPLARSCSRTLPPAGAVGPLARSSSRTLRNAQVPGPRGALALVPPAGFEPARMAPEATALSPELRGLWGVSTLSMGASMVSWQYLVRCAMDVGRWSGPAGRVSAAHSYRSPDCPARNCSRGATDAARDRRLPSLGALHP